MKITLENTEKVVSLIVNGKSVPARIWQGETDTGIKVHCFVTRIAIGEDETAATHERFSDELKETAPLRPELAVYPLRLIL